MSRMTSTSPLFQSAFAAGACTPADVLAFHLSRFGGFRMSNDDSANSGADKDKDTGTDTGGKDADKDKDTGDASKLGDAGKRALQAERDARAAADQRAAAIEKKFDDFTGALKSAFGVESKEADASDLVSGLQKQLDTLQHQTLVDQVARRHGITKDEDIELLRSATDKDVMEKLAGRLKPADDEDDDTKTRGVRRPRPDGSQGGSGTGDGTGSVSTGRDLYGERHAKKQ